MKISTLFALVALLTPGHLFGFARALDQTSATGTIFVVSQVEETITLTAFADTTNKRWLVLSPPDATLLEVPRTLLEPLEVKTRPVLQTISQVAPCEADQLVDEVPSSKELRNNGLVDVKKHPTLVSPDLQSYLDDGWVLREVELQNAGQGVQFSFTAERFEIPPRPATGADDRGELSLISLAAARMEPVNFKSQLPPTNIEIKTENNSDTRDIDRLLAAVFAEVDKNEKGAFITEFALDLPSSDFGAQLKMFSSKELPAELTVTRLRRFGDLGTFSSPIQLFPAFKMAGGDNVESNGRLRSGGYSADKNNFRTRLVIRKMLPVQAPPCENPVRLRASFDPTITDEVRKSLFGKWLLGDVPEIYWTVEPTTEQEPKPTPNPEPRTPTQAAKSGKCGGCTSAESTSMLGLLFVMMFLRRRAR